MGHLTAIERATIEKIENNMLTKSAEIGTLVHCWWECKMVQLLWKTVWRFFKRFKLPSYPAIPLWVCTPKNGNQGHEERFAHV